MRKYQEVEGAGLHARAEVARARGHELDLDARATHLLRDEFVQATIRSCVRLGLRCAQESQGRQRAAVHDFPAHFRRRRPIDDRRRCPGRTGSSETQFNLAHERPAVQGRADAAAHRGISGRPGVQEERQAGQTSAGADVDTKARILAKLLHALARHAGSPGVDDCIQTPREQVVDRSARLLAVRDVEVELRARGPTGKELFAAHDAALFEHLDETERP